MHLALAQRIQLLQPWTPGSCPYGTWEGNTHIRYNHTRILIFQSANTKGQWTNTNPYFHFTANAETPEKRWPAPLRGIALKHSIKLLRLVIPLKSSVWSPWTLTLKYFRALHKSHNSQPHFFSKGTAGRITLLVWIFGIFPDEI